MGCWEKFQNNKIVVSVGVTTFIALVVVALLLVFDVGSHNCSFHGSQSLESFGFRKDRRTLALAVTSKPQTQSAASTSCYTLSQSEAKLWEIQSGAMEQKFLMNFLKENKPRVWVDGVWLNAKFDGTKIVWKSNPTRSNTYSFKLAEDLQKRGAINGSCLVVKSLEPSSSRIEAVPCEETYVGLCTKQCWPKGDDPDIGK